MRHARRLQMLVATALLLAVCSFSAALPNIIQEHYRWREDNGSETEATWQAEADTPYRKQLPGENVRLRFCVANSGDIAVTNTRFRLEYTTGGTNAYIRVPAAAVSEAFEMADSPHVTNGTPATKQLVGSGTYDTGQCIELPADRTHPLTLGGSHYSNYEYCFRPTSHAVGGQTYLFRLSDSGAALDEYSRIAELTVLGRPSLNNGAGATEVSVSSATLNGTVTNTRGDDPNVRVYWGRLPGGTDPAAWTNCVPMGVQDGAFACVVTGLLANADYHYRAYATNLAGDAWAPSSSVFTTESPLISFSNTSYIVDEGATSVVLTVTLEDLSARDLTVRYSTSNGSARAGEDYEATSGILTWAAGSRGGRSFSVKIVDDSGDENYESVFVRLCSPSNCALIQASATVLIRDNDGLPTVEFAAQESSGHETNAFPWIEVTSVPASGLDVAVDYAVVGGSATQGLDYILQTGVLSIAAWSTGTNLVLHILDDRDYEEVETIVIGLSNPTHALLGLSSNHTYSIEDTDPRLPVVDNWKGAARIQATSCTLRGRVAETGRDDPFVRVYWGPNDGVTNKPGCGPHAWSNVIEIGVLPAQTFETNLFELAAGELYHYRVLGSNAAGEAWASSSENWFASDPPSFSLLENESMETTGVSPEDAWAWFRVGNEDMFRSDAFPRTGSHSMRFEATAGAYFYGTGPNAFRLTWNGQYLTGGGHPAGGIRPGFVLSGRAHVRASEVGLDPSTFTFAWRNATAQTNVMSASIMHGDTFYAELAMSNACALPPADVGDEFVPGLQRVTVGTTENDYFHVDDVNVIVGLPRMVLDPSPEAPVLFGQTVVGQHADVQLGVRNQGGAPGSVLYGAYVTDVLALKNPAWNQRAWWEAYDPDQVFEIVAGASLAASNDSGYAYATVRFAPASAGSFTGVVRVATSDPVDHYPGGGKLHSTIVFESYVLVGNAVLPPPTLSATGIAVTEGHRGLSPATFPLSLSRAVTNTVTVAYATSNGTAQAGSDYVGMSGVATVAIGQVSAEIEIDVLGDRRTEKPERFFLILSDPVHATLDGEGPVPCTIQDDDHCIFLIR